MTPANKTVQNSSTSHGRVIWITGLSGAGKTSLALEFARRLRRSGRSVVVLDGDELRWAWGGEEGLCFDRAARVELALRYARLAAVLSRQGLDVVVATISLFGEVHSWARAAIPKYTEVYLRIPIEELRRRDSKGIYSRFDRGEIKTVAGLDLAVEEPVAPDLVFDFKAGRSVATLAKAVMDHLQRGVAS